MSPSRARWPEPENEDEVHDVLAWLGLITDSEAEPWSTLLDQLEVDRRATRVVATRGGRAFWVAAERLPEVAALYIDVELREPVEAPPRLQERSWGRAEALTALLRGRVEALGPVTAAGIVESAGGARIW